LPELKPDMPPPSVGGGERRMKAVLVLAGVVAFVVSPWATEGFGGFAPDLFPIPQDRPAVQPAGYAFGIWGLIYLWLVVHAGFGLFARADARDWDAGRWPLAASMVLGAPWIAVANASAVWATVLIWGMWAGAVAALWRAPRRDRWLAQAPLGIYAGWLTAAASVSVGLMLGGYGVTGETAAAIIALVLALALGAAVQTGLGRAPEYGLTLVWALVAVVVANFGSVWPVAALAAAGALAMAAAALRAGLRPA